ncbi:MAG: endonuclease [Bacteroidales bacterium]|nr:endonuclease [Bacteroidales bacterium]
MKKWMMLGLCLAIGVMALRGQSDSLYKVAFYNVENLFHPSNDSLTADEAFTPTGSYHWSYAKYFRKISNVAKVLIAMGRGHPPAVVGLAEIECEQVLKDLCYRSPLRKFGYRYVHHDSPDRRGVDVALLYRDSLVTVVRERALPVVFAFDPQARTRDLLYVCLRFPEGDSLHIIVNHWTSRYGGYAATVPKRNACADVARACVDSLLATDPQAKILLMGDFNDYPTDESMEQHLRARRYSPDNERDTLFNLMYAFEKEPNKGSHKHEDFWGCLDQMVVSRALLFGTNGMCIAGREAHIFQDDFLLVPDEKYGGVKNFRTFLGPRYVGGFSDHLPVFIEFSSQKR